MRDFQGQAKALLPYAVTYHFHQRLHKVVAQSGCTKGLYVVLDNYLSCIKRLPTIFMSGYIPELHTRLGNLAR
jgi:hypothetical protein